MPEFDPRMKRRSFVASLLAAGALPALASAQAQRRSVGGGGDPKGGPVVIASGNGLEAVREAMRQLQGGADPLDAAVAGVRIVEDDPNDMTVGYGGLPNEEGVVQLDSSVMHGPMHRAGAVAALENIRNPAAVAREVARRTDHVMLVGAGALRFAKQMGFKEENLLTEKARQAWLDWKTQSSREDDWLSDDELDLPVERKQALREVMRHTGTIHLSVLDANGDLAGTTTTSGLSWKLPGRVGDSPIIGAGLYTDNEIGSAGATGRGEAVIQVCGARTAVARMEMGDTPTQACLHVLGLIADRTKAKRLLNERGEPNFNVIMYAVRKDGLFGAAAMRPVREFAVADKAGARLEKCAALFER